MQSNWIISERVRRTSDRADLMVSEWGRLGERGLMIWEHIEMPKDNACERSDSRTTGSVEDFAA